MAVRAVEKSARAGTQEYQSTARIIKFESSGSLALESNISSATLAGDSLESCGSRKASGGSSPELWTAHEYEEKEHLQLEFSRLADCGSFISSATLLDLLQQQNPGVFYTRRWLQKTLKQLKKVANHGALNHSSSSIWTTGKDVDMDFSMFSALMSSTRWSTRQGMTTEQVNDLSLVQHALIEACANHYISKIMNIGTQEFATHEATSITKKAQQFVEPGISVVIILNAVMIGIATDTQWSVTDHFELFFAIVFVIELLSKLWVAGWRLYFCGPDRRWNWFDAIIVALAVWDSVYLLTASRNSGLSGLSAVRILRLARFVRLVRLLKHFKELALMVSGLLGALRTLFWAMILLGATVYVLAVMLTQAHADMDSDLVDLDLYFSTVPWSMLTVFQCLTDGCSDDAGRPLLPQLVRVHGPGFALAYCVVVILIMFGLFNLIAAIFVENTLQASKSNDNKIAAARRQEDVRVAKQVKMLIGKFSVKARESNERGDLASTVDWSKSLGSLMVSRQHFDEVMEETDTHKILYSLDFSPLERQGLFDVLDADGDGSLQLNEIISGILNVRGEARKSDVVAVRLAVRSLQKRMRHFEHASVKNQALIFERMDAMQSQLQALCNAHGLSNFTGPPTDSLHTENARGESNSADPSRQRVIKAEL